MSTAVPSSVPIVTSTAVMPARPISSRAGFLGRWITMGSMGIKMMFHDRLKLMGTLFGVVFAVVLGNFQAGTSPGALELAYLGWDVVC